MSNRSIDKTSYKEKNVIRDLNFYKKFLGDLSRNTPLICSSSQSQTTQSASKKSNGSPRVSEK